MAKATKAMKATKAKAKTMKAKAKAKAKAWWVPPNSRCIHAWRPAIGGAWLRLYLPRRKARKAMKAMKAMMMKAM